MSDRDERGKDVTDRLAGRFGNDESADQSERSKLSENDKSADQSERSEPSENDKQSQQSKPSKPSGRGENADQSESELNVKEDWMGRYMYIPPKIHDQFDDEYERLRYECGRDLDWKPKKNKHYYPVVATKGIEDVADMRPDEFVSAVTELEWFNGQSDITSE